MTWAGEHVNSGLYVFTEDGSPGTLSGNDGDLIRWNSVGAPEFTGAASVTGINAVPIGVRVGVGLDSEFDQVGAAISGGYSNIHVIGNTTEDGDIVVGNGLDIQIYNNSQINMNGGQFTYSQHADVHLQGHGEIRYGYPTTSTRLFDNTSFDNSILKIDGIDIRNESTAADTQLADGWNDIRNCTIFCADVSDGGLRLENIAPVGGLKEIGHYVSNVIISGGGTSCHNAFIVQDAQNGTVDGVHFIGQYDPVQLCMEGGGATTTKFSNFSFNIDGATSLRLGGIVTNIIDKSNSIVFFSVAADQQPAMVSNVDLPLVELTVLNRGGLFTNCHFQKIDLKNLNTDNNDKSLSFNNCNLGNGLNHYTLDGMGGNPVIDNSFIRFTNTYLNFVSFGIPEDASGVIISSCYTGNVNVSGTQCIISNTIGSGILTLATESSNNYVVGCDFDSIVDNGTNNIIINSTIPIVIDDLSDIDTTSTAPEVDDVLRWDGSSQWLPASTGIAALDEGSSIGEKFSQFNFVGAGVSATDGGAGVATVTIAGAGGAGGDGTGRLVELLHLDSTQTGSVGMSETTIATFTVPAGTLTDDGDHLLCKVNGRHGLIGVDLLKYKWGATEVLNVSRSTSVDFVAEFRITRRGTSDQICYVEHDDDTGNQVGRSTATEDETGSVDIVITGENTTNSSNDAVFRELFEITYVSATGVTGKPGAINDLSDVDTASAFPASNESLVWDVATSNWIPSGIISGNPVQGDLVAGIDLEWARLPRGTNRQILKATPLDIQWSSLEIDELSDVDTVSSAPEVNELLVWNGVSQWLPESTGIAVLDEGSNIGEKFSQLDFLGAGVTATDAGAGVAAVTIPADIVGPGTSTDNAIVRWNGTAGTSVEDSSVLTTDSGNLENAKLCTFIEEFSNGDSGAGTVVINWNEGQKQKITLTGDPTLVFFQPPSVCNLLFKIVQDGGGGRSITWPTGVLFPGGTDPALTAGGGTTDIVSFYYDGNQFFGVGSLDFS